MRDLSVFAGWFGLPNDNLLPAPTNDRLSHETDRFTGSGHVDEDIPPS
jgi:hypothetical protein